MTSPEATPVVTLRGPDGHEFTVNVQPQNPSEIPLGVEPAGIPSPIVAPELENVTASTQVDVKSFFENDAFEPVNIGVLAVTGIALAAVYRKSKFVNRALATHHERKAEAAGHSLRVRRNAAVANIDSMVPENQKTYPAPKGRRTQIIEANPVLSPLNRVGVVDFTTGKIVDGSAHHFGTRNPGSFTEFKAVTAAKRVDGGFSPTARTGEGAPVIGRRSARNYSEKRDVKKYNRWRDKIADSSSDRLKHVYNGPHGEILEDHHKMDHYIEHTDLTRKQVKDLKHTAKHVHHANDKGKMLFDRIDAVANGRDAKSSKQTKKSIEHTRKAAKHRQRAS